MSTYYQMIIIRFGATDSKVPCGNQDAQIKTMNLNLNTWLFLYYNTSKLHQS
jgi:hypothetical protein